jgi:aldose 1-epimerase
LGEKDCQSLQLQIGSSAFLESDDNNIPTGNIISVDDTDYDFRKSVSVGNRQQSTDDESLKTKNGYDHCFVLDRTSFTEPKAILTSEQSLISLSIYTDQPAIQLYTGFYLSGNFNSYQALCLEAQNYPNAINVKHFQDSVLLPNEDYFRIIVYAFK